jgi:predicted metalloprotease
MGSVGGIATGGGIIGLIIYLLYSFLGGDPSQIPTNEYQQQPVNTSTRGADDTTRQFLSVVLAETEDVWTEVFRKMGETYPKPVMVLYTGAVQSACGTASSAVGPFYCPGDQKLYIDASFLEELRSKFGAPGDFAAAYVIAHEVGHHVQNLLGITDKIDALRGRLSEKEYNKYSVALELQADFLAGVWSHYEDKLRNVLDPGDIEEAMRAAASVGDDKLEMQAQGYVVPETFTHGTSEQRMYWFKKGYDTGDVNQGNTFESLGLTFDYSPRNIVLVAYRKALEVR